MDPPRALRQQGRWPVQRARPRTRRPGRRPSLKPTATASVSTATARPAAGETFLSVWWACGSRWTPTASMRPSTATSRTVSASTPRPRQSTQISPAGILLEAGSMQRDHGRCGRRTPIPSSASRRHTLHCPIVSNIAKTLRPFRCTTPRRRCVATGAVSLYNVVKKLSPPGTLQSYRPPPRMPRTRGLLRCCRSTARAIQVILKFSLILLLCRMGSELDIARL
jgi:hypothetical protein